MTLTDLKKLPFSIVAADQLRAGDIVSPAGERVSAFDASIVEKVDFNFVHLFRPYCTSAGFTTISASIAPASEQTIVYTGAEQYVIERSSQGRWLRWQSTLDNRLAFSKFNDVHTEWALREVEEFGADVRPALRHQRFPTNRIMATQCPVPNCMEYTIALQPLCPGSGVSTQADNELPGETLRVVCSICRTELPIEQDGRIIPRHVQPL